MPSGLGAVTPRLDTMRPDAILNTAIGMTGLRGAVQVVGIRSLLFFSLAVDTLYLIKTLIKSPLGLIQRSLTGLAQDEVRDTPTLDLVNNDEFLPVFSQINQLIQKQRGVIEDSKAHLDDIVRGAPDPILSFSTEGSIHLANPGARRFFGLTDGSLETIRIQDLFSPDLESVRSSQGAWELSSMIDFFEKAKSLPVRIGGKIGDGTWVPIEVTISQVQAHSTNLYTLIVRDLRSQVETERVLLEARVVAEKANRMKSDFLANMSHELRTPLNAVLGFTQLLEGDQNLTSGQKSKLGIISRSGEHLLGLINDILDISKIEAGKFELRDEAFDLRQLIEDMKEMFSLRATSKGLVLDMELIEPCPQYVHGDLGKLRQILINLLGNSVKFTDLGGRGLVVGAENDRISFVVRDTGRGMPPDEIRTILQPFRQSSLNHNEGGTGLGLAITQRFVEMMGGELQIESEEGKGSTFRFSLLLPIVNSTPKEEREQRAIIGVRGTIPRALVVDDKVENQLVLKEMLERVGMSCMEAENGKEAIERFTSYYPDLVFMDIKMPVMDGYKAAQEIRILSADKVPLFALTASAFTHDEEKIRNVGFTDYLSKPFKQSSIFALLENHTSIDFLYEEYSPRKEDSRPISLEDLDVTVLKEIVGTDFWDSLGDCIIINDFSGIGQLISQLDDPKTEDLSVFLRLRVDQFDERGLDSLIRTIRGGSHEF